MHPMAVVILILAITLSGCVSVPLDSAKTESAAIEDALTDLARRVVERTVEDW